MAEQRQHQFYGEIVEGGGSGAVPDLGKEVAERCAGDAAFADLVEPQALLVQPKEAKRSANDKDREEYDVLKSNRSWAGDKTWLQSAQINGTVPYVALLGQRHLVIDR
jgi:hypothetical protein